MVHLPGRGGVSRRRRPRSRGRDHRTDHQRRPRHHETQHHRDRTIYERQEAPEFRRALQRDDVLALRQDRHRGDRAPRQERDLSAAAGQEGLSRGAVSHGGGAARDAAAHAGGHGEDEGLRFATARGTEAGGGHLEMPDVAAGVRLQGPGSRRPGARARRASCRIHHDPELHQPRHGRRLRSAMGIRLMAHGRRHRGIRGSRGVREGLSHQDGIDGRGRRGHAGLGAAHARPLCRSNAPAERQGDRPARTSAAHVVSPGLRRSALRGGVAGCGRRCRAIRRRGADEPVRCGQQAAGGHVRQEKTGRCRCNGLLRTDHAAGHEGDDDRGDGNHGGAHGSDSGRAVRGSRRLDPDRPAARQAG